MSTSCRNLHSSDFATSVVAALARLGSCLVSALRQRYSVVLAIQGESCKCGERFGLDVIESAVRPQFCEHLLAVAMAGYSRGGSVTLVEYVAVWKYTVDE